MRYSRRNRDRERKVYTQVYVYTFITTVTKLITSTCQHIMVPSYVYIDIPQRYLSNNVSEVYSCTQHDINWMDVHGNFIYLDLHRVFENWHCIETIVAPI